MKVLRPCPRWWVCSTSHYYFHGLCFILFTCLHYLSSVLCVGSHLAARLLAWYSGHLSGAVLSTYHMGLVDQIWVIRLDDKRLYAPHHLTSPVLLLVRTSGGSLWKGIFVCKSTRGVRKEHPETTKLC